MVYEALAFNSGPLTQQQYRSRQQAATRLFVSPQQAAEAQAIGGKRRVNRSTYMLLIFAASSLTASAYVMMKVRGIAKACASQQLSKRLPATARMTVLLVQVVACHLTMSKVTKECNALATSGRSVGGQPRRDWQQGSTQFTSCSASKNNVVLTAYTCTWHSRGSEVATAQPCCSLSTLQRCCKAVWSA